MDKEWLTVHLDEKTRIVLSTMSRADCRTPAQQLIWFARQEAKRRGLLPADDHHSEIQAKPELERK